VAIGKEIPLRLGSRNLVTFGGAQLITYDTIPDYYDWLSRYVQFANWMVYRDRFAAFTMHKNLAVTSPVGAGAKTAGVEYVNNRLFQAAGLGPSPRVLDAGCGFGGTIFNWHARLGGSYDGLTLSRVQLRVAQREARRRGVSGCCRFQRRSYDSPIEGPYDAVLAIESLIHSRDLRQTIPNLANCLRPGGQIMVLDDMARAPIGADCSREAQSLRYHWGCSRYPTRKDYVSAISLAGLKIVYEDDLTAQVQPRPAHRLDELEAVYNRLYGVIPFMPARTILSAYIGGLALERLYLANKVTYSLIVARRQDV
jgi:SAM-dependent methyltransferase